MKKNKGRTGSEQLVPISMAARMLGLGQRTIHSMCKRGLLQPIYLLNKGAKHFNVHEVAALADVLKKGVNLSDVATIATRAYVTAKANEQRLNELFLFLGLRRKALDTTEEAVVSLYEQARYAVTRDDHSLEDIEEWGQVFFGVEEGYLGLVTEHTGSAEPWKTFLDLGVKLAASRPLSFAQSVPDVERTYKYLEVARSHIRMAAYFYCREKNGVAIANDIFGEGDITEKLLGILSMN